MHHGDSGRVHSSSFACVERFVLVGISGYRLFFYIIVIMADHSNDGNRAQVRAQIDNCSLIPLSQQK